MKDSPIARQVGGTRYRLKTDARAKKVYRWEWLAADVPESLFAPSNLPVTREVGKGLARLCAKVALRRLIELTAHANQKSPEELKELRDHIRADFKARFTKEVAGGLLGYGGLRGCYFTARGWRPWTIAHEVAHWIDHWQRELTHQRRTGHSPEWLGWYVFLLIDVLKVDREALKASLATAGLRFVLP